MTAVFRAVAARPAGILEGFGRTEGEAIAALRAGGEALRQQDENEWKALRVALEGPEVERIETGNCYHNGEVVGHVDDEPEPERVNDPRRAFIRHRHVNMTGGEFVRAMTAADLSEQAFCKLTGIRQRTMKLYKEEGCPFWAKLLLMFLSSDRARKVAFSFAEANIQEEDTYRANREGSK